MHQPQRARESKSRIGLDGVVVAETEISHVDERGRLVLRGLDLASLADAGYEDVVGLLWNGALPDARAGTSLRWGLARARCCAHDALWRYSAALERADALGAVQEALAGLAPDHAVTREVQLLLAGAVPVVAAAWWRRQIGEAPIAPQPNACHAEDLLRMAGLASDPARVRALDRVLVALAEHGMSASTFAARVVTSTGADAGTAVVAAASALRGSRHSGTATDMHRILTQIGHPERAGAWVAAELEAHRRIPGFGHAIYRARDPRIAVLESVLADGGFESPLLPVAHAVERAVRERLGGRVHANVDLVLPPFFEALDIPPALYGATFATARAAGWLAHVEEQGRDARIIRPCQRYVGPRAVSAA